jgi:hypothetical protein|tara:strand:+ start:1092 stop:1259 length:168 start_codon:yes stop_codon:yes gene_type:complete
MSDKQLSQNEKHLLKEVRSIDHGSVTVYIKNGTPWRLEEVKHSVVLGSFTGELIP